jgi:acyl-CoA reductase-like NAD-dependent aldehyde dehydrogenase
MARGPQPSGGAKRDGAGAASDAPHEARERRWTDTSKGEIAVSWEHATGLYINGRWEAGTAVVPVVDKYSGEVLKEVGVATRNDVDRAVASAKRAMRERPLSARERHDILLRAAALIEARAEDFARMIVHEGGKPLKDARTEVIRGIETVTLSAEEAKRIHGETVPLDSAPGGAGRVGVYIRVPVGVVAAISPFNFPLNLVVHKVAPALAAGCAVVLKPATTTPLTACLLVDVLEEAGLPPGYVNLVVGSGATVGDWLVQHPDVQMVTFTGSPPVGQRIKERSGLKRVTLELGNNSGNLVHDDARLDVAADLLARRAFGSAGQFCVSVQRIYVQERVVEAFTDLIVKATERLKTGDPNDPDTDVGPLISEAEAERVIQWVDEAVAGGARVLTGGRRRGAFVEPTLLTDVDPAMKVVCQEVFGPVASIIPYGTFEEGLAMLNDTPYGLQAGVFTNRLDLAWKAAQEVHAGGVIINDTSAYRADLMPYGGVGLSGIGREGPRFAVEEMSEIRMVVFNLPTV